MADTPPVEPTPAPEPTPTPTPPPPTPVEPGGGHPDSRWDDPPDEPDRHALGDAGTRAIQAERERAKQADKRAKAAEKKAAEQEAELREFRNAQLSETEKLQKQAEEGTAKAAEATQKLRRANLITALAEQPFGLVGGKARAAARLLDGVEFDDADEPTNLKDAVKAMRADFGDELFGGATPPPEPTPEVDLHQGPRVPVSDQDEAALMAQINKEFFPQTQDQRDPLVPGAG